MPTIPGWLDIDEQRVVRALRDAVGKLDNADGEAVLDFSSVCRIDSTALRALEEFIGAADGKGIRVVLCGVNVRVYKVLKLTKLAHQVSFTS